MDHYLMLNQEDSSSRRAGGLKGEKDGGASKAKGRAAAQPAVKANGDQRIELVKMEESQVMRQFKTTDEADAVFREHWGEEVERGELGEDNHSNKGGWHDINPVQPYEYTKAAYLLETKPEEKQTTEMLTDMYQRDHRAVNKASP